ncbi:MAG: VanZ family protein [Chitinophagaceae bacterium]|nr:VanZ family protein [Chitinophagaceae bacterium]
MNKKRLYLILIIYTLFIFYLMIIGFGRETSATFQYNLVPFATIGYFLHNPMVTARDRMINLLGNIVVFIPFGWLLPRCFSRVLKAYSVFLIGLLFLEMLQLITRRGMFDVDDIILNSLGFFVGFGLLKFFRDV